MAGRFLELRKDIDNVVCRHDVLRDRLMFVADLSAYYANGDLLEIGAGRGCVTTGLAAAARKHGRRAVAIDPWTPGVEGCQGGDLDAFLDSMLPYRDILDDFPSTSLEAGLVGRIRARPFCFAYIDGLRTHSAILSDIITVGHAAVIAVRLVGANFTVNLAGNILNKVIVNGREEVYLL